MSDRPDTPLLDTVETPEQLRKLEPRRSSASSPTSCAPRRSRRCRSTGGHLGAGLGVVELTVALHYVFDTPRDRLVWDVGHQCYPHKILTGRRDRIRTLRMGGGLSGFTKRSESEYDPFGAAHSSTSISAALGFAVANKLAGTPGKAIAVIGDGAMSAGMAYEAMNNAEAAGNRLVVILNDNDMSIAPPVGGLSHYLARLVSSGKYLTLAAARPALRPQAARAAPHRPRARPRNMPAAWRPAARCSRNWASIMSARSTATMSSCWSRSSRMSATPTRGRCWSTSSPRRARAMARPRRRPTNITASQKFDVITGEQAKAEPGPPSYTERVRQGADRRGGARRQGGRDHRGDAVRHRPRQVRRRNSPTAPSTSASPSSMR